LSVVIAGRIALAKDYPGPVYLHRLGTHPLEHGFGHFRMTSCNQDRWMRLEAIVQQDFLLKGLRTVVGVGQRIQARAATVERPIMATDADTMSRFSVTI
jgi:hypothetical protein